MKKGLFSLSDGMDFVGQDLQQGQVPAMRAPGKSSDKIQDKKAPLNRDAELLAGSSGLRGLFRSNSGDRECLKRQRHCVIDLLLIICQTAVWGRQCWKSAEKNYVKY